MASQRQPSVPTSFSLRSLEQLRRIVDDPLAHPNFVENYPDRRDAADIAFFAHNASLDSGPNNSDEFHPAFYELRTGTRDVRERHRLIMRIRRSVQDHVSFSLMSTGKSKDVEG